MLVKRDPELIQSFLEDYSNIKGGFCSSVIIPQTEDEVIKVASDCRLAKTPLTVTGAGTGVTGARIPFGGKVLSLEKLNSIGSINPLIGDSAEITIGPGVALKDLLLKAESEGYFYPPDPTEKTSFVMGNISTAASGARSFKYGTTREYVAGLRILLSGGEIIDLKRGCIFANKRKLDLIALSRRHFCLKLPEYKMPDVKNAAGYYVRDDMDAVDLFIGHEGTLGIILGATLRLIRKPEGFMDCYAFFKKPEDAISFAFKARKKSMAPDSVLDAVSIEYFDVNALNLLREKHSIIPNTAKGAIYFQQESNPETINTVMPAWADLITECNGILDETWFAQTDKERQQLIDIRHDLPDMVNEYLKRHNLSKVGTDIAVRYENMDEMIRFYNITLSEAGLRYLVFGHVGQAHLHVNILPKDAREHEKAVRVYERLVERAISLGGTPTAEHGIGKVKHKYLEMLYGKQGVTEMASLKKQLDHSCILGLDNIFPRKLLQTL